MLGYDPTTIPVGQSGYGAGSGAPNLMFGFLKHLWATHSRHDALHRYIYPPCSSAGHFKCTQAPTSNQNDFAHLDFEEDCAVLG